MKEKDMEVIADFIDRIIKLCIAVQQRAGKNLKEFEAAIKNEEEISKIQKEVMVIINYNYILGFFFSVLYARLRCF